MNRETMRNGNIFKDFEPSLIPPQFIDDPVDTKPENWVDQEK